MAATGLSASRAATGRGEGGAGGAGRAAHCGRGLPGVGAGDGRLPPRLRGREHQPGHVVALPAGRAVGRDGGVPAVLVVAALAGGAVRARLGASPPPRPGRRGGSCPRRPHRRLRGRRAGLRRSLRHAGRARHRRWRPDPHPRAPGHALPPAAALRRPGGLRRALRRGRGGISPPLLRHGVVGPGAPLHRRGVGGAHRGNGRRRPLGLRRVGMGRLLGLGPGGERRSAAVAGGHCPAARRGGRRARRPGRPGRAGAGHGHLRARPGGHRPHPLGRRHLGARLRRGPLGGPGPGGGGRGGGGDGVGLVAAAPAGERDASPGPDEPGRGAGGQRRADRRARRGGGVGHVPARRGRPGRRRALPGQRAVLRPAHRPVGTGRSGPGRAGAGAALVGRRGGGGAAAGSPGTGRGRRGGGGGLGHGVAPAVRPRRRPAGRLLGDAGGGSARRPPAPGEPVAVAGCGRVRRPSRGRGAPRRRGRLQRREHPDARARPRGRRGGRRLPHGPRGGGGGADEPGRPADAPPAGAVPRRRADRRTAPRAGGVRGAGPGAGRDLSAVDAVGGRADRPPAGR